MDRFALWMATSAALAMLACGGEVDEPDAGDTVTDTARPNPHEDPVDCHIDCLQQGLACNGDRVVHYLHAPIPCSADRARQPEPCFQSSHTCEFGCDAYAVDMAMRATDFIYFDWNSWYGDLQEFCRSGIPEVGDLCSSDAECDGAACEPLVCDAEAGVCTIEGFSSAPVERRLAPGRMVWLRDAAGDPVRDGAWMVPSRVESCRAFVLERYTADGYEPVRVMGPDDDPCVCGECPSTITFEDYWHQASTYRAIEYPAREVAFVESVGECCADGPMRVERMTHLPLAEGTYRVRVGLRRAGAELTASGELAWADVREGLPECEVDAWVTSDDFEVYEGGYFYATVNLPEEE